MEEYISGNQLKKELIGGKIYLMSPTAHPLHATISGNLHTEFSVYLRGKKCRAYSENLTVIFDDKNKVVPDLVVVCDPKKMTYQGYKGIPPFIIEILSPGSMVHDKKIKFKLYESYGVPEYWIVMPKEKSIEQYILADGKYELNNMYSLPDGSEQIEQPNQIIYPMQFPDLQIDLNTIFEDIYVE